MQLTQSSSTKSKTCWQHLIWPYYSNLRPPSHQLHCGPKWKENQKYIHLLKLYLFARFLASFTHSLQSAPHKAVHFAHTLHCVTTRFFVSTSISAEPPLSFPHLRTLCSPTFLCAAPRAPRNKWTDTTTDYRRPIVAVMVAASHGIYGWVYIVEKLHFRFHRAHVTP